MSEKQKSELVNDAKSVSASASGNIRCTECGNAIQVGHTHHTPGRGILCPSCRRKWDEAHPESASGNTMDRIASLRAQWIKSKGRPDRAIETALIRLLNAAGKDVDEFFSKMADELKYSASSKESEEAKCAKCGIAFSEDHPPAAKKLVSLNGKQVCCDCGESLQNQIAGASGA